MRRVLGAGAVLLLVATALSASGLTPAEILREADRARGNLEGMEWQVSITSEESDRTDAIVMRVWAKGFDVLAETLAPPKRKGDRLLLRKSGMWFHKPSLSKPVPVSKRQKLLGRAAYGDIVTTDYAGDYRATPLPDETVNGDLCHVLDLRAVTKKTTYDRIVYWISKDRLVGLKADYYTVSGKKFKSAVMQYEHRIPLADGTVQLLWSRMEIRDELVAGERTTIELYGPVLTTLPDAFFDVKLLAGRRPADDPG